MSVNYYARNADGGELHIGQHASGSEFLFRAHPDRGLVDCDAWFRYLGQQSVSIVSECGVTEPLIAFWPHATRRPADLGGPHTLNARWSATGDGPDRWRDQHGHPFANYEFC